MADSTESYVIDYKVDLSFLAGRGKIVPMTINSLTKSCDYYKNFFPVYEAEVVIQNKNVEFIRDNQSRIYVHLMITARYHVHGGSHVSEEKIVLNQVFVPFFEPGSFTTKIQDEDMNDLSGDSKLASASRNVKLTMYSAKGLMANKVPVNAILSQADGVDVGTAILYILNQAKSQEGELLFDQVIIDRISQKDKFFELIIPPNNIAMSLRELQIRYGIYHGGLVLFYDEPMLYILEKYSSQHDYAEDQFKTLFLKFHHQPLGMSKIEKLSEDSIRYVISGYPHKAELTVYEAELLGNVSSFTNFSLSRDAIQYVDGDNTLFQDPLVSIKNVSEKHIKTGDKYNIEYDELNNPLMISAFLKAAGPHQVYHLPDIFMVDYSSFRPNSNIVFELDYSATRDIDEKGFLSLVTARLEFNRVNIGDNIFSCKATNLMAIQS